MTHGKLGDDRNWDWEKVLYEESQDKLALIKFFKAVVTENGKSKTMDGCKLDLNLDGMIDG